MRRAIFLSCALVGALLVVVVLEPAHGVLGGRLARTLGGYAQADTSPATGDGGAAPTAADTFEPVLGLPATGVTMIGASPAGAPGEAWAQGAGPVLLRYTSTSNVWQTVPLADAQGNTLSFNWSAATATARGGILLLGADGAGDPGILTRDPGGAFAQAPAAGQAGPRAVLASGESLASKIYAPLDDTTGHTGALIVPSDDGAGAATTSAGSTKTTTGSLTKPTTESRTRAEAESPTKPTTESSAEPPAELPITGPGILHYDGEKWTREPIELAGVLPQGSTPEASGFTPEALACGGTQASPGASSAQNCWLLAAYRSAPSAQAPGRLALFRRAPSPVSPSNLSGYVWLHEGVSDPEQLLGPPSGENERAAEPLAGAQMLTVTAQGVWVDFQGKLTQAQAPVQLTELVVPDAPTAAAPATMPSEPSTTPASTIGPWCSAPIAGCTHTLGAPLPDGYRSFAWPAAPGAGGSGEGGNGAGGNGAGGNGVGGNGVGGNPGTRIITGSEHGTLLELAGMGNFVSTPGAGGDPAPGGAFSSPQEGWVDGGASASTGDLQGQSQLVHVTSQPQGDQLQQLPVPFRYPLLALAQAPGSAPGDPGAQAVAVGDQGQIGRYLSGQGWRSESLYDASGKVQTPTLRGVAWPQAGRAYAVGDNGAMWLWRADTGLWEPDPAKPLNFIGNLTAVAFSTTQPNLGYAVGKDGVLLKFGKSWSQETLPANLQQVNFTSVAFAGGEAIASYRQVLSDPAEEGRLVEAGGVAIQDGSGWHVDPAAANLLGTLPDVRGTVLSKVAALADGGAVAAGPGLVIERDTPGSPWRFASTLLPEAQNVSALSAYRDPSGAVRAVVSIDLNPNLNPDDPNFEGSLENSPFGGDVPSPSGAGQPPPFPPPDPLPDTGYLLEETASGWQDMEHMAFEAEGWGGSDMPARPDPILALLVDPAGDAGLAVGGQTYDSTGTHPDPSLETAAAMRFPAGGSLPEGEAPATIATTAGHATFALGGDAACAQACADDANEQLGPDVALTHALQSANAIATGSPGGLRAFLYTGSNGGEDVFARDLAHDTGALPTYATGIPATAPGGAPYYSFTSTGASGGPVRVIVLDCASGTLDATQQGWLETELAAAARANTPALVMGNAAPGAALAASLVTGGASAYLFDSAEQNVQTRITFGARQIPAFGTGTLGYIQPPAPSESDSLRSSGFLLLDVDTDARNPATNIAPVSARIEPNIDKLALAATDGVLLRRSQVALFEALARRPVAGADVSDQSNGEADVLGSEPYDPIPFDCQGANCAQAVPSDYTFASSNPDIGNFVAHDPASTNPHQVQLGANQLPVADAQSGLFCAFNAGTTTVSITTGGLTYSEPVTVQAGSVEYPCGTVPLKNPPALEAPVQQSFNAPELPPATNPPPVSPHIQAIVPPPPPPPVAPAIVHHPHPLPVTALAAVPLALPALFPLRPVVPPPAPNPARPTPPSGTAPVSQTVGVEEQQQERERATELVHHMTALEHAPRRAVHFDPQQSPVSAGGSRRAPVNALNLGHTSPTVDPIDNGPMPAWPVALVLVAVAGGIGLRRRGGSERLAYVTVERRRDERG